MVRGEWEMMHEVGGKGMGKYSEIHYELGGD
jgi:hypothetical protein